MSQKHQLKCKFTRPWTTSQVQLAVMTVSALIGAFVPLLIQLVPIWELGTFTDLIIALAGIFVAVGCAAVRSSIE
jgi:hypothetical protein